MLDEVIGPPLVQKHLPPRSRPLLLSHLPSNKCLGERLSILRNEQVYVVVYVHVSSHPRRSLHLRLVVETLEKLILTPLLKSVSFQLQSLELDRVAIALPRQLGPPVGN